MENLQSSEQMTLAEIFPDFPVDEQSIQDSLNQLKIFGEQGVGAEFKEYLQCSIMADIEHGFDHDIGIVGIISMFGPNFWFKLLREYKQYLVTKLFDIDFVLEQYFKTKQSQDSRNLSLLRGHIEHLLKYKELAIDAHINMIAKNLGIPPDGIIVTHEYKTLPPDTPTLLESIKQRLSGLFQTLKTADSSA